MSTTLSNIKHFIGRQATLVKENPIYTEVKHRLLTQTSELGIKFKRNGWKPILAIIFVVCLLIFFLIFYKRVSKFLYRMDYYYKDLSHITSIRDNKSIMNGKYKLCDFYIASSYKSYLPCTNYLDYASLDSIKKALFYGARYIDLDVMNKSFGSCPKLVVCNGIETGNWHLTTSIDFEETIKFISEYAFSNLVNNNADPLFININLKTWYNKDSYEVCASILNKYFSHKFLSLEYGYKGQHSGVNIGQTNIKNLLNKVIIICDNDVVGTAMDEIVNIGGPANIRDMTYKEVEDCIDIEEYREFNKEYMTRVIPSFTGRLKQNFNYLLPYYLGCQFICMNYTKPDKWMKSYIDTFGEYSFVLKPTKLRS